MKFGKALRNLLLPGVVIASVATGAKAQPPQMPPPRIEITAEYTDAADNDSKGVVRYYEGFTPTVELFREENSGRFEAGAVVPLGADNLFGRLKYSDVKGEDSFGLAAHMQKPKWGAYAAYENTNIDDLVTGAVEVKLGDHSALLGASNQKLAGSKYGVSAIARIPGNWIVTTGVLGTGKENSGLFGLARTSPSNPSFYSYYLDDPTYMRQMGFQIGYNTGGFKGKYHGAVTSVALKNTAWMGIDQALLLDGLGQAKVDKRGTNAFMHQRVDEGRWWREFDRYGEYAATWVHMDSPAGFEFDKVGISKTFGPIGSIEDPYTAAIYRRLEVPVGPGKTATQEGIGIQVGGTYKGARVYATYMDMKGEDELGIGIKYTKAF